MDEFSLAGQRKHEWFTTVLTMKRSFPGIGSLCLDPDDSSSNIQRAGPPIRPPQVTGMPVNNPGVSHMESG